MVTQVKRNKRTQLEVILFYRGVASYANESMRRTKDHNSRMTCCRNETSGLRRLYEKSPRLGLENESTRLGTPP